MNRKWDRRPENYKL